MAPATAWETLERQQMIRKQLQEERRQLAAKGDVAAILQHQTQHSAGVGSIGRGRGVSNLPAWLVKKQQAERAVQDKKEVDRPVTGNDGSVRTVILSNLTAPGDIDEDLSDDVRDECEEQCGPVEHLQIKDANPPLQPVVEVWVRFVSVAAAEKAERLFHGRRFGNRRITAKRFVPH